MDIQAKAIAISRANVVTLAQFLVLLSAAIFAPLAHSQIITGSIVNATLFIAAATLGLEGAIMIGVLPSFFALLAGTLPMPLAPLIPFIILSNAVLIITFIYLKKNNYWLKIVVAAGLKFIFLSSISLLVIKLLFTGKIVVAAATMLSWPQLITALIGGALAYMVLQGRNLLNKN
ncbi:MAG TPA: ECF transporter S component [Candidatus Saccharimonadales bacterium]|nr:ECF transporter S component [Candidatus Saccharimonadales bacterium]